MDTTLERYLNDHLAGSLGAVDILHALIDVATDERALFYRRLLHQIEMDRDCLKDLLARLHRSESDLRQLAGNLTAKAGRLKFIWEGLDYRELGAFEALEVLCLGIHGKSLLWKILGEIRPFVPEWSDISFEDLERSAITQRDSVEALRLSAGLETLLDQARR